MDPLRHSHRKTIGFGTRRLCLHPRPSPRRGNALRPHTLKTAHPAFQHLALFNQSRLHSLLCSLFFYVGLSSNLFLDQALDRLVSSSSKHYCSSTDDLSPGSLPGVLLLSNGTLLLEGGFTLRCLQRLSLPHFASLLCRWHDNSCTSGASTPVLSY